ncbi:hypothetical protein VTN49DRAFT_5762 [Thermomyces lanuginosus]|uniref:uncharacterized protein n=1 Tax=Thermomyces lanuginosus TaxID=5541 RepID=UPI003742A145
MDIRGDREYPYETAVRPGFATVFTLSQPSRKSSAQTFRLLRWLCLLWSLARGPFRRRGSGRPSRPAKSCTYRAVRTATTPALGEEGRISDGGMSAGRGEG